DGESDEVLEGDDHVAAVPRAPLHAEAPRRFGGSQKGSGNVKPHDEELMRYFDGEMSREEARALEKTLEGANSRKVRAMEQVGEVIRARYEASADDAAARLDGVWAKLERQLDAAPVETPARATPTPGVWERIRAWFDAYRGHVLTGAVCAAA